MSHKQNARRRGERSEDRMLLRRRQTLTSISSHLWIEC